MRIKILILVGIIILTSQLTAQHERTEHWMMRSGEFRAQSDTIPREGVIFLGNSITEGFDLGFYFPVTKPINRGISGDHIDGLLQRLDYSVIDLKPSRLFILIGINDIGAGDSDSIILANFNELLDRLTHELCRTEIFIQSILPTSPEWSNCPKEKIRRLNDRIKEFVSSRDLNWIDLYPQFVNASGYLDSAYTSDGLHLNATGYQKWHSILTGFGLK